MFYLLIAKYQMAIKLSCGQLKGFFKEPSGQLSWFGRCRHRFYICRDTHPNLHSHFPFENRYIWLDLRHFKTCLGRARVDYYETSLDQLDLKFTEVRKIELATHRIKIMLNMLHTFSLGC